MPVSFRRMGDRGLVIDFNELPGNELTARISALARAAASLPYVVDACPGQRTLLLEVDSDHQQEVMYAWPQLSVEVKPIVGTDYLVEVVYDGEDLASVCEQTGLTVSQFAKVHSAEIYQVRMIGSPGFIYLSDVDPSIAVPRRDIPRQRVEAGSVGIAGLQTGIYGLARPGGWRIIGHVEQVPKVRPSDRVRFVP